MSWSDRESQGERGLREEQIVERALREGEKTLRRK